MFMLNVVMGEKMSIKSILLSTLSLILLAGVIVGEVFLFKAQLVLGLLGILLGLIPIKVHQAAVDCASGVFDKWYARFIIPVLALIAILFIVLAFTLWI